MPKFNGYEKILETEAYKQYDFVQTVFYDEIDFFSLKKLPFFVKVILFLAKVLISGNPHENKFFITMRDYFLSHYLFEEFNRWVFSKINPNLVYDSLLVIKGYGLSEGLMHSICARNKVLYQWDNIVHFPSTLKISKIFDSVYTFDKGDASSMGWFFLPNFYLPCVDNAPSKSNDFFFVGVYSELRFEILSNLISWCRLNEYSYFIKLYSPDLKENELITNRKISKEDYNDIFVRSKYIIEITKKEQIGYSQRYLEAISNRSLFVLANAYSYPSCQGRIFTLFDLKQKSREQLEFLLEAELTETESELLSVCSVSNWLSLLSGDHHALYFKNSAN